MDKNVNWAWVYWGERQMNHTYTCISRDTFSMLYSGDGRLFVLLLQLLFGDALRPLDELFFGVQRRRTGSALLRNAYRTLVVCRLRVVAFCFVDRLHIVTCIRVRSLRQRAHTVAGHALGVDVC